MIVIYRYSSSPDKKPKAKTKQECWKNFKEIFLENPAHVEKMWLSPFS